MVRPVIVLVAVVPSLVLSTRDKLLELVPWYTRVRTTPLPVAAVQLKATWLILTDAAKFDGAATRGVVLAKGIITLYCPLVVFDFIP